MLFVDNGAFIFEYRTNTERGITLLSNHFSRFGLKMHIGTEKITLRLNAYYFRHQVYLTHKHYLSLTSPTPPWASRKKKAINRDSHLRTKNIPSAEKHQSSK